MFFYNYLFAFYQRKNFRLYHLVKTSNCVIEKNEDAFCASSFFCNNIKIVVT